MTDTLHTAFLLAMKYEIENIFDLADWIQVASIPFPVYEHREDPGVIIVQTGVGRANAAAATQFTVSTYPSIHRYVNLGTAGCLNPAIKIGAAHAVTACRFFDVDVTAFDYALGQIPECKLVDYQLGQRLGELPTVKVLTGDRFLTTPELLDDMLKEFPADFVEMEVAAIAHTLHRNNRLDQLESYKAPSDYANGQATKDFYANEQLAFANLRVIAADMLSAAKSKMVEA